MSEELDERRGKVDDRRIAEYREALDCARSAILDAIYCEDGLDGATGEDVIKMITDALGDEEEWKRSIMQQASKET